MPVQGESVAATSRNDRKGVRPDERYGLGAGTAADRTDRNGRSETDGDDVTGRREDIYTCFRAFGGCGSIVQSVVGTSEIPETKSRSERNGDVIRMIPNE